MGMKVIEPRCKVCKSPNRLYYEQVAQSMIETNNKIDYKALRELALKKFKEQISVNSFKRHFEQGHLQDVDQYLESKVLRKIQLQKRARVKIPLDVVSELISNLELAKELTGMLVNQMEKIQPADAKETALLVNSLRGLLSEIRMTLKHVSDLSKKLKLPTQYSREEVILEVARILSELGLPELKKARARLLLFVAK